MPAVCGWHEHHERARREIEARFDRDETLCVAAPALAEAYAVLTRLHPPHRLNSVTARSLLMENFALEGMELVALEAHAYRELLARAPERGVVGGLVYDAVIVECATQADVDVLLTFNVRQFRHLAPPGMEIVLPP